MRRTGLNALYPLLLIAGNALLGCLVGCASPATAGSSIVRQHESTGAGAGAGEGEGDGVDPSSSSDNPDGVLTEEKADDLPAAPPPPVTGICSDSDLTLCFTFEGESVDHAPNTAPIAPSEVTNLVYVEGKEGKGAAFGPASALRFDANAAFDLPAGAATVEAWIKRASSVADAVVFDDDARFSLTINADGHIWCKSSGGGVVGTRVVPVEQWVHVACVVDGGSLHAYVDGVEDGLSAGGVGVSPMSTAAIGGNAPFGDAFVGIIDSVRLFHVARTPAQIAAAAKS